jgi:hypothetical protein
VLHLRVITPTDLRDPVIDVLSGDPGVTHLVVHRDAAREPEGDAITADIARESANDVVDDLKALGLKERGAITLEALDTVLSTRAYRAEDEAEGEPADAVIWDELISRTREESTLTATYLTFLCIACMIAAVGVVTARWCLHLGDDGACRGLRRRRRNGRRLERGCAVRRAARGEPDRHRGGRRPGAVGLPAGAKSMTHSAAVRPL